MITSATICHSMKGRVRIAIRKFRTHPELLSKIGDQLMNYESIHEIKTYPKTGTLLILFDGKLFDLIHYAKSNEIFKISKKQVPKRPGAQQWSKQLFEQFENLNQEIQNSTQGSWTLPLVVSAGLLGLTFLQITKRQFLPPAWTLLGDAYQILSQVNQNRISKNLASIAKAS